MVNNQPFGYSARSCPLSEKPGYGCLPGVYASRTLRVDCADSLLTTVRAGLEDKLLVLASRLSAKPARQLVQRP
ncbi:hypothetical protein [Chlorogloeopsis sp. ULAP02]|uniref:hypothetical protein n=1 Tax=Chlorogloeopsis sp. ULAP02 TaxID=3107926 RepID=UPI003136F324